MPAYVVALMTVHDPDLYLEYAKFTPEIVRKYGGKFLTRGQDVTCLEDTSCQSRLVVSEWPSKDQALAFFSDPEYLEHAAKRKAASTMQLLAVQEGVLNSISPDPNV